MLATFFRCVLLLLLLERPPSPLAAAEHASGPGVVWRRAGLWLWLAGGGNSPISDTLPKTSPGLPEAAVHAVPSVAKALGK